MTATMDYRDTHLNGASTNPYGNDHGFDFGNITSAPSKAPLERERERGASPPPQSEDTRPRSSTSRGMAVNGVADFFSPEVFQIVLHNPATAHQLLKFSQARMSGENMEFLERVDRYNTLLDELTKTLSEIHKNFISPDAVKQLNLSQVMMKQMNADIKMTTMTTLPAMELMFTDAQEHIENLLASDIYPRFVKHQMTTSAVKALSGGSRQRYAGLGDCFVLTNPAIADNPIVYASDGFVSVTGYSRSEIIPRNCRFLQGNHTDHAAVRRLKVCIGANKESVELLLNYRKTGEPFWNLLYVTPLLDSEGRTAFFLGGQINCSTTIHNCSDILRLLSIGEDSNVVDDPYLAAATTPKPGSSGLSALFKTFRSKNNDKYSDIPAGMEQNLINKIERLDFKEQMEMFYTAYSKFLVLSHPSLEVKFYSPTIVDMLCLDPKENLHLANNNIFKILMQHAPSMPRDFKYRIKSSLKSGRAVSADINLVTKKSVIYRRSERLATHWTPLKDEKAEVKWVVVTLTAGT